jgi:hypothetical protein
MKQLTPKVTYHRQKLLLALLQSFGGELKNIDLQKYLFLFTQLCQQEKSYEFVPFKYGCFSFQSYADRKRMIELGAISANSDYWQLDSASDYLSLLQEGERKKLTEFNKRYSNLKGDALVREVYVQYPYYAINSEIAPRLLTPNELEKVAQARPAENAPCFFTIGYEGKSFEHYLNQLIRNNVKVLCDVRKNPLSRKFGFSKKALSDALNRLGIGYVHIPALGIESEKRQELHTQTDYNLLFDEYEKTTLRSNKDAIDQLVQVVEDKKRVAITCFELDQCMCHRGRVAQALARHPQWNYEIRHL